MRGQIVRCFLLLTSLAPAPLWGRAVDTIVRVTDSSGAVTPRAKVTATREATQVSQSALTGSSGTFAIPHLDVGTYTVRVDVAGFALQTITRITLDVSQQRDAGFTMWASE